MVYKTKIFTQKKMKCDRGCDDYFHHEPPLSLGVGCTPRIIL